MRPVEDEAGVHVGVVVCEEFGNLGYLMASRRVYI